MAGTSRSKARVGTAKKRPASKSPFAVRKQKLLAALRQRGWTVRAVSGARKLLPPALSARYRRIPVDVERFLSALKLCRSPNATVWFLTAEDYAKQRGSGFRWNEIERMSLEGADGDMAWQAEIRSFWDGHLPIMLAVHSDYDYLAVRLADGAIVHGYAPEWEEPSTVAPSLAVLLSLLQAEAETPREQHPWALFVGKGS